MLVFSPGLPGTLCFYTLVLVRAHLRFFLVFVFNLGLSGTVFLYLFSFRDCPRPIVPAFWIQVSGCIGSLARLNGFIAGYPPESKTEVNLVRSCKILTRFLQDVVKSYKILTRFLQDLTRLTFSYKILTRFLQD